ncbi:MAG: TonB-dependent receptor [Porticoccus sp.]|nr:TonB-dependent receptor [Porticoccus sp.]
MNNKTTTFASLLLSTLATNGYAEHSHLEEINITGHQSKPTLSLEISPKGEPVIDTASLLKKVPGANINNNGAITGIAQYRGLYGDRVSVHIDHAPSLTGGPNAMDTPLSYTPPMLLKSLSVHRGIAPVSVAQESIGGHMTANLDRGEFTKGHQAEFSGGLFSRFNSTNDGFSNGIKSVLANKNHKVSVLASHDEGDETHFDNNDEIGGTQYRRSRYDISYGWQDDSTVVEVYAGKLDTRDTGTPALPMDINHIDSDMVGINLSKTFNDIVVSGNLSYNHVDHGMDNFSQRTAPIPTGFRQNKATAHNTAWSLQAKWPLAIGSYEGFLTVGTDGNETVHDSTISNPNAPMFEIKNFENVERNSYGVFTEWEGNVGAWKVETGIRYTQVSMDSDDVSASGMMGMMGVNAGLLAANFNSGDLDKDYHNVDLVLNASRELNANTTLNLGLGRKNRAPSYQERYLWLPLPSAGGLADGRSYTGNLDIDKETAYEVTVGIDWISQNAWANPQVFYRYIDDYIQGVPSTNMTANMVSTMMSGDSALMFDNIDAEMYGADLGYGYKLSAHFSIEGTLSYVRGKRDDEDDNLYRVAPLNNRLALVYADHATELKIESVLYAKQSKVSSFNDEEKTSGYGIINLLGNHQLTQQLNVSAGIENLFDRKYQDHLAGYNRNGDSDIGVGDRLPGAGRNLSVSFAYNW